jgi:photosystem II stability/assembly factor-like uncharacterized protein
MAVDPGLLQAFQWRNIGPHRGGRSVAVSGDPVDPATFYFGACSGGIWKTTDAGTYWQNVSDGFVKTAAVGAIEVAPSDPNVIYAGMGEACIRGNVSHGDGIYKSTNAGKTWTNVGLTDTRHIGRMQVHPTNPDVVYVAALGHAFGPNKERGVFRTTDGGKTWQNVLFRNEDTGAIDIQLDPRNPRVLFAAFWDVRRAPWELRSGGPGSGIFRSTDGGDTWTEVTDNKGLPKGLKGRIGLAVSPAQSGRVWALVEAEEGGLFRSDNGGETWERISEDREIRQRPWYYMHVFADPQDADTCYILNLKMWKSVDGGKTFSAITTPHGDNHGLWIDPNNPRRMVQGNDGGANVTFNGGDSWSTIYNQPTAQFYHVTTDTQTPYRVYGTQQDNSAISTPSRTAKGAIPYADNYVVGTSESGHIQVRPDNPNVVFSGAIGSSAGGGGNFLRYDHGTGQTRIVTAWPEVSGGTGAGSQRYRFQWTYPIVISSHDVNALYITGNVVFKSMDEGHSWEVISPDLTRNDASKLGPSGGPITKDTTGAEHYCTIFAFTESQHEQGVFWAGSDDGLIHISRDNAKSWQNITPSGLPEWATVAVIEQSPHDKATAYVAAYRYKLDDYQPYLFKTADYGATWSSINGDLPSGEITRIIREDPVRKGLLYAGTETGVFVSLDDGGTWQRFHQNLPVVPVYDLQIKEDDLVAATHGRSFWIMDDLSQLRQINRDVEQSDVYLFKPRDTIRARPLPGMGRQTNPGKNYSIGLGASVTFTEEKDENNQIIRTFLDAGQNPPDGVVVNYLLKERPKGDISLTFLDEQGNEIKTFTSRKEEQEAPPESEATASVEGQEGVAAEAATSEEQEELRVSKQAGANRFIWNLRAADAIKVPGDGTSEGGIPGPHVPPGTYQVRLSVNGQTKTQSFRLLKEKFVQATDADLKAAYDLHIKIRDKLSEANDAVNQIRSMKGQAQGWIDRARAQGNNQALIDAANATVKALTAVEDELIQPKAKGQLDSINFPVKLTAKIAGLTAVVAAADFAPTKQSYEVFDYLSGLIDDQLGKLRQAIDTEVKALNEQIAKSSVPGIVPTAGVKGAKQAAMAAAKQ